MRADLVTSTMLIGRALFIWLAKVTTGSSDVHIDIHSTGALGAPFYRAVSMYSWVPGLVTVEGTVEEEI